MAHVWIGKRGQALLGVVGAWQRYETPLFVMMAWDFHGSEIKVLTSAWTHVVNGGEGDDLAALW